MTKNNERRAMSNKQSTKSRFKKPWLQSWMLKIARAFGLDALQCQLSGRKFQVWMNHKAQPRNGMRRIYNTLNEYRKLQRGDSPKPPAASMAKPLNRLAGPVRSGRGDTIVEVILATALIAAATGLAYSMSNHNLGNGVSAGQRSQALSLAGAQIERIKNAYLTNSTSLNSYKIDKPFCILGDGSEEDANRSNSKCANFTSSPYSVVINYNKATLVFKTDVSWSSNSNSSGQDQLTLYYKLPG